MRPKERVSYAAAPVTNQWRPRWRPSLLCSAPVVEGGIAKQRGRLVQCLTLRRRGGNHRAVTHGRRSGRMRVGGHPQAPQHGRVRRDARAMSGRSRSQQTRGYLPVLLHRARKEKAVCGLALCVALEAHSHRHHHHDVVAPNNGYNAATR